MEQSRTTVQSLGLLLTLLCGSTLYADVRLHAPFTNQLVLQQGMQVPIWGAADEGEEVAVSFQNQIAKTTAKQGKWMVRLASLKAGGPFTMVLSGKNKIVFEDVLVGEVWIASGQSNMHMHLKDCVNPIEEIAKADLPRLRLLNVPLKLADAPQASIDAGWVRCTPKTAATFSAVAYYFGRDLQRTLDVPIGLINATYGATPAEAWTSRRALEAETSLRALVQQDDERKSSGFYSRAAFEQRLAAWKVTMRDNERAGKKPPPRPMEPQWDYDRPCVTYNSMIAPLVPYAMRGVIWYQGESNAGRAHQYQTLFPVMIRNWRGDWRQGDFPFLFVQLAPFMKIVDMPAQSNWAELREAQRLTTLRVPNTAMAVITDVGDEADVHPKRKETAGQRLALAARALAYRENIIYSGPAFQKMKIVGRQAILSFQHVGKGLEAKDGPLAGFTIAGADRRFHNALAEIRGAEIVVQSPAVSQPVAVRYGWANYPVVNLWNRDGLPASPFRTDDF